MRVAALVGASVQDRPRALAAGFFAFQSSPHLRSRQKNLGYAKHDVHGGTG
jgi:hypothetical protein